MASAEEIRKWSEARAEIQSGGGGKLLFDDPPQVLLNRTGGVWRRCAGEQRVIVEIEIAAQLAELNGLVFRLVLLVAAGVMGLGLVAALILWR